MNRWSFFLICLLVIGSLSACNLSDNTVTKPPSKNPDTSVEDTSVIEPDASVGEDVEIVEDTSVVPDASADTAPPDDVATIEDTPTGDDTPVLEDVVQPDADVDPLPQDGLRLHQGGFATVGNPVGGNPLTARIVGNGFEHQQRLCAATYCVTGGIEP
ncbi:MAG: hypothetical protein H0U74_04430 [Bradymonadaceae bacterium]|nr:hypothetical protein [Lujinxingiaceae bacterium]